MYWLLDYAEQENLRQRMIRLQSTILNRQPRDQSEQIFPFIGRKSRTIARTLIENLTDENALVVDPFGGSGTFAYAALDACLLYTSTKDVDRILQNLMLASGYKILPEKTLIIFDEVQDCPKVINAMKYFCENAPQYHIACAGSLLGIALAKPSSFPVGKVNLDVYKRQVPC